MGRNGIEVPQDLPSANPAKVQQDVGGAQLPSMSDELQEKIDRIDVLEDNLEKERARLQ